MLSGKYREISDTGIFSRYSLDYVTAEEKALAEKRGMWSGEFTLPCLWRREERSM